jgi:pimeloyl-ACP methyl ester carboxylesterase
VKRWFLSIASVLLVVAAASALYFLADPERLDLNDAARQSAPGRFVRLTDGYTHYELGGPATGRVVVLAAGFSVPYYIWDPTFAALTGAGYRVLRYDYFGRGFSDRPDVPFTQDFYIRQLAELLDAVHITEPIDLAGLSFGGSVITSFADRYPARVRSLIYFDPSFRSPGQMPALASTPFLWNYYTAIFDERWWASQQPSDFLHPETFPDWADRYRVQVRYRGFRRARLSEIVSSINVDQDEELDRVGMYERPVLIIWGKQDPSVPFEFSEALLEQMPRARLVAVESSGHLPQMEQPQIVNAALLTFLQRGH